MPRVVVVVVLVLASELDEHQANKCYNLCKRNGKQWSESIYAISTFKSFFSSLFYFIATILPAALSFYHGVGPFPDGF